MILMISRFLGWGPNDSTPKNQRRFRAIYARPITYVWTGGIFLVKLSGFVPSRTLLFTWQLIDSLFALRLYLSSFPSLRLNPLQHLYNAC